MSLTTILFQSNFDDTERNRNHVPVNYREFIHKLEQIIEPTRKKYTPTDEEFKDDKNRFDQYKDNKAMQMGQEMVKKRNEEQKLLIEGEESLEDKTKDDSTSSTVGNKPYRLNTENFF